MSAPCREEATDGRRKRERPLLIFSTAKLQLSRTFLVFSRRFRFISAQSSLASFFFILLTFLRSTWSALPPRRTPIQFGVPFSSSSFFLSLLRPMWLAWEWKNVGRRYITTTRGPESTHTCPSPLWALLPLRKKKKWMDARRHFLSPFSFCPRNFDSSHGGLY